LYAGFGAIILLVGLYIVKKGKWCKIKHLIIMIVIYWVQK
jgi:hypothetical protein